MDGDDVLPPVRRAPRHEEAWLRALAAPEPPLMTPPPSAPRVRALALHGTRTWSPLAQATPTPLSRTPTPRAATRTAATASAAQRLGRSSVARY